MRKKLQITPFSFSENKEELLKQMRKKSVHIILDLFYLAGVGMISNNNNISLETGMTLALSENSLGYTAAYGGEVVGIVPGELHAMVKMVSKGTKPYLVIEHIAYTDTDGKPLIYPDIICSLCAENY